MTARFALFLTLLAGCGGPAPLDQPNDPPPWPLENITDVERSKPVAHGAVEVEAAPEVEGADEVEEPDDDEPDADGSRPPPEPSGTDQDGEEEAGGE